jgi:hypothetical protein
MLPGTSSREWRDEYWKVQSVHVRILTETAVSRRKLLRTIRTSSLCRSALATAVLCSALVTGAALPASADGGTGGDTFGPGTPAVTVPGGAGGALVAGGYNSCISEPGGDGGSAGASGNIVARTNKFDVEPL